MSLTKNQWIAVAAGVAALLLAFVVFYVASPQRALGAIHAQIERGEGLGEQMPLTQRELQAVFAQHTLAQARQDLARGNGESELLILGPAMAEVLAERKAWEMANLAHFNRLLLDAQGQSVFREAETSYRGISRYVVRPVHSPAPALVLKRKGLGWQIEGLEFQAH